VREWVVNVRKGIGPNSAVPIKGQVERPRLIVARDQLFVVPLPRCENYRIRSLLYAGKPNWELLATVRRH